jgi:hypothetical protein
VGGGPVNDNVVIFLNIFLLLVETGSHCEAQTGLDLAILLPQPPKCWDYKCVPPLLAPEHL